MKEFARRGGPVYVFGIGYTAISAPKTLQLGIVDRRGVDWVTISNKVGTVSLFIWHFGFTFRA